MGKPEQFISRSSLGPVWCDEIPSQLNGAVPSINSFVHPLIQSFIHLEIQFKLSTMDTVIKQHYRNV